MHSIIIDAYSLSKAKGNTSFAIILSEGRILSSPINIRSHMLILFHFELSIETDSIFLPFLCYLALSFRRLLNKNGLTSSISNVYHKL